MGSGAQASQHTIRKLHQGGPVSIREADCLSLRAAHLNCVRCVQACPVGALRLGSEGISLGQACDGCGLCAIPCPTGAIFVEGFEAMERQPRPAGDMFLECGRVPRKKSLAASRQVSCLAGVSVEHLLLHYLEAEVHVPVLIDRGWCLQCPTSRGLAQPWNSSLRLAREILSEAGVPAGLFPWVELHPLATSAGLVRQAVVEQVVDGRRGFLRRLTGQPTEQSSLTADLPTTRDKPVTNWGRRRLLGLAAAVANSYGGRVSPRLFPALEISEACSGQRACVAFCPTGALAEQDDKTSFDAAACIACGACVTACKSGALRLRPEGDGNGYAGVVELAQSRNMECRNCGRPVQMEERVGAGLCLSCVRRRQLTGEAAALFG